jgi:hypothetical protein
MDKFGMLTLTDFAQQNVKVEAIPPVASTTFKGQTVLEPLVNPVPYGQSTKMNYETIQEFKLTKLDHRSMIDQHHYNHITQNIKLAPKYGQYQNANNVFKQSVLSKNCS